MPSKFRCCQHVKILGLKHSCSLKMDPCLLWVIPIFKKMLARPLCNQRSSLRITKLTTFRWSLVTDLTLCSTYHRQKKSYKLMPEMIKINPYWHSIKTSSTKKLSMHLSRIYQSYQPEYLNISSMKVSLVLWEKCTFRKLILTILWLSNCWLISCWLTETSGLSTWWVETTHLV